MLEGGRRGRAEAEQEAIGHGMMKPAAGVGEGLVAVVAAVAAAAEILQRQRVAQPAPDGAQPGGAGAGADPEIPRRHRQRKQGVEEARRGDRQHRLIRDHRIERPRPDMDGEQRRAVQQRREQQHRGDRQRRDEADQRAVRAKQPGERARPGVVGIALLAELGEGLGNIDPEFMRRGVLAAVETGAAAVAQIGEVAEVGRGEVAAQLHGGEHRAIALAIAAGVADLHVAAGFGDRVIRHR